MIELLAGFGFWAWLFAFLIIAVLVKSFVTLICRLLSILVNRKKNVVRVSYQDDVLIELEFIDQIPNDLASEIRYHLNKRRF